MTWALQGNIVDDDPDRLRKRQQAAEFLGTLKPTTSLGQPGGAAPAPVGGMSVSPMPGLSMPYSGAPIVRDSQSVTTRTRSKDEKALMGESDKLQAREVAQLQEKGKLDHQIAEEQARQAEAQAALRARQAEAQAALHERIEGAVAARQEEADRAYSEWKEQTPRDFFADKTTGVKVAAVFATALGGFGAAMQSALGGGPYKNAGAAALDRWVDEDLTKQRAEMEKKRDTFQMAREGVADARAQADMEKHDFALREAAAWEQAAAIGRATLAKMGVPQADVDTNATILHAEQKAVEKKQQSAEGLRSSVTNNYMSMSGQGQDPAKQPGYVYGVGGQALAQLRDPKKADDASATIQASRQLRDVLVQLKEMDKGGIAIPGTDAYAERQALSNQALIQMKEVQKLGAIQGADMGMLTGQIGSWLERTTGRAGPKLDKALDAVDRGLGEALDRYGLPGKQLAPQALGSSGPATQGAPQGPASKAPAGPAGLPPGAVPGEYKGHKGYRLGNKFYVDE